MPRHVSCMGWESALNVRGLSLEYRRIVFLFRQASLADALAGPRYGTCWLLSYARLPKPPQIQKNGELRETPRPSLVDRNPAGRFVNRAAQEIASNPHQRSMILLTVLQRCRGNTRKLGGRGANHESTT